MATMSSFFNRFLSFFLLLVHLSCFTITPAAAASTTNPDRHKRRLSSLISKPSLKPQKALSSSWSYLKKLFKSSKTQTHHLSTPPRSSSHSLVSLVSPPQIKADPPSKISDDSDIFSGDDHFFPLRNDIFPCTTCGEIFHKPQALDHHQAVKHSVSELLNGDTGKNIVQIIFNTGWTDAKKTPVIHRILKIHNSVKILARFEEYRELVKSKAARNSAMRRDERCVADGNELLRFHCSTFLCDLGTGGSSGICNQQYCSVCGIIKSGFSAKLDGISTLSSSSRAHVAIPEEIEEEFKFMNVKRAMLVCRVVAGRVGCDSDVDVDKEGGGFDSVVGRNGSGTQIRVDEEELLVFNPRAVLPCFVIVYTV
ncbi:uncharacterized protein LOC126788023 [Argentina anserina]|uniref:uncharacterized protein LOC126788023 n=1 Tax=Argentina anserina TaxID=57926 RepID=UPI00217694AC|nr:uncharacterized protein LOC126788023 [Potentilla anserina]